MGYDWLIYPGLFIGYFVLDVLGTKNVLTIQRLQIIPTANVSTLSTMLGILGTYVCVKNSLWNLIPISLGVYAGSIFAMTWEIEIRRREAIKMKNLSNVKNPIKKIKHRGVHAKTKQSINKHSKNYVKSYVGQGK